MVRVAIVGVGNCANSFVQGLTYYGRLSNAVCGLVRPQVGAYGVGDIEVVAAFDVADTKVGIDVAEAIWAKPNGTYRFADVADLGVKVQRGPTKDGIGRYLAGWITESPLSPVDVAKELKDAGVDVVVNYLPVGSQEAASYYAEAALEAGCALVNCIPVFIASNDEWRGRFEAKGLPIIGDDIKSQVGATIIHRVLASLFHDRGVTLDRTLQLNIGGNGDFLNMLERERLESKKLSKTNAVVSVAGGSLAPGDVHIGPSDYVSWLGDRKWAYIRLEGRGFGEAPLNVELKLEVWDSPNSAGIVIDAVRCAKLALDRREGGVVPVSAYFMKSPPVQFPDSTALAMTESWITG